MVKRGFFIWVLFFESGLLARSHGACPSPIRSRVKHGMTVGEC